MRMRRSSTLERSISAWQNLQQLAVFEALMDELPSIAVLPLFLLHLATPAVSLCYKYFLPHIALGCER